MLSSFRVESGPSQEMGQINADGNNNDLDVDTYMSASDGKAGTAPTSATADTADTADTAATSATAATAATAATETTADTADTVRCSYCDITYLLEPEVDTYCGQCMLDLVQPPRDQ